VGDEVTALFAAPLKDAQGVVVPAGSRLQGRVDFVQRKSLTDDGWFRLLFTRVQLPDGRGIDTLASASFHRPPSRIQRDRITAMLGLGAIGALVAGHTRRIAGMLGGAIIGLTIVENQHRYGRDLTLRAGDKIQLRLGDDIIAPSR
jgi:hypothetical protein